MTPTPWTPAEDALLREARRAGKTYEQMSEAIGRSTTSISRRIARLGLKKAAPTGFLWTPEAVAKLRKLAPTHTIAEMAKSVHRTPAAVKHKCRELGIKPKPAGNARSRPWNRVERGLPHVTTPIIHIHHGEAGEAQRYLQRAGYVVYRSDALGKQVQDGFFWRCGRVVLDDAGLVEKAGAVRALERLRAA